MRVDWYHNTLAGGDDVGLWSICTGSTHIFIMLLPSPALWCYYECLLWYCGCVGTMCVSWKLWLLISDNHFEFLNSRSLVLFISSKQVSSREIKEKKTGLEIVSVLWAFVFSSAVDMKHYYWKMKKKTQTHTQTYQSWSKFKFIIDLNIKYRLSAHFLQTLGTRKLVSGIHHLGNMYVYILCKANHMVSNQFLNDVPGRFLRTGPLSLICTWECWILHRYTFLPMIVNIG